MAGALTEVEGEIRTQPSDVKHRIFLFQLLCVLSDWKRAGKQLDVIRKLDDSALAMVQMYQTAISCELFRESVFAGKHDPIFMGKPEEWQALLLQAFQLTTKGEYKESLSVRNRAFELAPASPGSINGNDFSWVADADSRLGPILEMFIEGKYFWVSFSHIDLVTFDIPTDLRDLVWLPAHVKWRNGGEAYALVPARYPGSQRSDVLALGRLTEWDPLDGELYAGYGQKVLATDVDDFSIYDLREMNFIFDSEDSMGDSVGD